MTDDWIYSPPGQSLQVLHHDRDLLAIDKPSGLLSVPGRRPEHRDSAQTRAGDLQSPLYPVHRLDLDTSGVMLLATRRKAERELFRQFRERRVRKQYLAVVQGHPPTNPDPIDLPLRRLEDRPRSVVCPESGRPARTLLRVLSRTERTSLVLLTPHTGRSHQLRVHLLAIGHPILGDRFYAPEAVVRAAPRLMLHAWTLQVEHPHTGAPLRIEAPIPSCFPHLPPERP